MVTETFYFADFFAGIGGFHYALSEIGGKCVFASESDKFARLTYRANFVNSCPDLFQSENTFNSDIRLADPELIPYFDLLCAGFPCQPFSIAGRMQGFDDARGDLFFEIVRIVQSLKQMNRPPKVLLLENVKNLLRLNKGQTFSAIKETIENDLGYHLAYKVLNSRDFGLPQNRERLFMVAWLPELATHFNFPEKSDKTACVADILEQAVESKYTLSDAAWLGHLRRKEKHLTDNKGFGYSLVRPDSCYTRTVTARYYKDGSEILLEQAGANPRKLTPREIANLQGFPLSPVFRISVSDTQAYKQLGNAISVPVVEALGVEIKNQLLCGGES